MLVHIAKYGQMSFDAEASKALIGAKVAIIRYAPATKEVTIEGFTTKPENNSVNYYMTVMGPDNNKSIDITVGFYGRWADNLGPNYDFKLVGNRSFDASVDGTKIRFTLAM